MKIDCGSRGKPVITDDAAAKRDIVERTEIAESSRRCSSRQGELAPGTGAVERQAHPQAIDDDLIQLGTVVTHENRTSVLTTELLEACGEAPLIRSYLRVRLAGDEQAH